MSQFQTIAPEALHSDPFTMIGKEWMLVTARKPDGSINTMTASWGGVGILWNKKVAFVFIRPQRHTKAFIDAQEQLTLSFYDEAYRKTLSYLGTMSGKDEDKINKAQLHPVVEDGAAYFEEANTVLLCKKLYQQELSEDSFLEMGLVEKNYPNKDFHTMYVVEITKALAKQS